MKYDPTYKPTGAAAKQADLPDGFAITGTIRMGARTFGAGDEEAYAATKPLASSVDALVAADVLSLPESKKK